MAMIFIAISNYDREKETKDCGEFWKRVFHVREVPFLNREGNKKRALSAFLWKGQGTRPESSPSCTPEERNDIIKKIKAKREIYLRERKSIFTIYRKSLPKPITTNKMR